MTESINPTGVLEYVDPRALELEPNVRLEASITKQLVASIRENGVLVPIVAVRNGDGTLRVRAGQRRTLAAREAGLTSVPAYVTDHADDTATRVVTQLSENDHRLGLKPVDRVLGIQTLLDTGLSATKVAKRLAVSMERVRQSKTVAGSQVALDALNQVSLAEAAAIAEFEDDEDAVHRLVAAAGRNYFDHELARLRQARESAAAYEAAAARYREQGYTVLDENPRSFDPNYVPLHSLLSADGEPAGEPADPTQWAVLIEEQSVVVDKETGEPVDETGVDWNTEGQPQAQPAEGLRHADTVTEKFDYVPTEYYCLDPAAAGLTPDERFTRFSGTAGFSAQQRQQSDAVAAQRDKHERRKVIALNKAADAAQGVRREFVRTMLSRKTPPKGAAVFVARSLTADSYLLSNFKADEVTVELLGVQRTVKFGAESLLDNVGDARAAVVTLGLVLGALEARTPKDAWRGGSSGFVGAREYLGFLAQNGYTLSRVEKVMTGELTADDCFKEMED